MHFPFVFYSLFNRQTLCPAFISEPLFNFPSVLFRIHVR
uniref:Uncharacterized protein n=1 Tax=Anguilla anguilla TaxID=7936 RepID=A0A0E9Q466_ANGAN